MNKPGDIPPLDSHIEKAFRSFEATKAIRRLVSAIFDLVQWIGVLTLIQFAAVKMEIYPLRILVIVLILCMAFWISSVFDDINTFLIVNLSSRQAKVFKIVAVVACGLISVASTLCINKLVIILAKSQLPN